jgi:chromosomal replication initiator protein
MQLFSLNLQMETQDTANLWHEILESIKVSISPANFTTWFAQTHLSELKKDKNRFIAEVGCNSAFVKNTLESRYFGLIQDSLAKSLDAQCDLIFLVKEDSNKKIFEKNADVAPLFRENKNSKEEVEAVALRVGLRLSFTFDNFAVSSSNQLAHAAAEAVASDLGTAYNPLFIWGGVGIGKTHLMHAVGHKALGENLDTNIYCCTGEQFTNDIVEGIRNKSTASVRQKYRRLKALFIDDIQFIAGKDKVQEEFFHTFNDLVSKGGQIILTSDKPPSEISKLEERLRSRFEAGLIVDIAPPEFELRCAITDIKAKQRGIELPTDMIQLIAGNFDTPRKIEGLLTKLVSEVKLRGKEITPENIEALLGKSQDENGKNARSNPNEVISAVSKYYSLGKRSLLGSSRSRPIARPRQLLMYLLRIHLGLPLQEVGRLVGNRDHTTVMHAVDTITHLASNNVGIREDLQGIKAML